MSNKVKDEAAKIKDEGMDALKTIIQDLEDLKEKAEPHLGDAKDKVEKARKWVKKNPEKAVAAAAAIGALTAALLSRRK